jgi:hypothetical protein
LAALSAFFNSGSLITQNKALRTLSPIAAVRGKIRESGTAFLGSTMKLQEALGNLNVSLVRLQQSKSLQITAFPFSPSPTSPL